MNTVAEPVRLELLDVEERPAQPLVAQLAQPAEPMNPSRLLAMAQQRTPDDIDRLERLMRMELEWKQHQNVERIEEQKRKFIKAFVGFKAEGVVVRKNQEVGYWTKPREGEVATFVGYRHADLSDVTDVTDPALARHGMAARWKERIEGKTVWCTCIVSHVDGHEDFSEPLPGPYDDTGKKNLHQQMASSLSYLRRYTLLGALGLSTKDGSDDDARSAEGGGDAVSEGDPVLLAFTAAALNGEKALREHYDASNPTEEFWTAKGAYLRKIAKCVDQQAAKP